MHCPQVRLDPESRRKFLTDPTLVALELTFGILSVGNVLVLHYLISVAIPFPITITWFQFLIGLVYARILGEFGREYPQMAYFVPLKLEFKQMKDLIFPTLTFLAMIVLGNMTLGALPSVAIFPVAAALAVCAHHFTRFLGCGQIYRPIRWASIAMMFTGFFISCFDTMSVGARVVHLAIGYAVAAAAYRGCFLERAMHVVRGFGNSLHNQQTFLGVLILPIFIFLTRERHFLVHMPTDFFSIWTWLMWGCLSTAAVLPFVKNIIANRLIKLGGQPPWRAIEVTSMLSIFVLGFLMFDGVSALGLTSFLCVFAGRSLNSLDAIQGLFDAKTAGKTVPIQRAAVHAAEKPFLDDQSGAYDPFDAETRHNPKMFDVQLVSKDRVPEDAFNDEELVSAD